MFAALLLLVARTWSAEPDDAPLYRRVFVPEEDLRTEARGLIPLKREEFERRAAALARQPRHAAPGRSRIQQADYYGRLVRDQIVDGKSQLMIGSSSPSEVFLSLEPCSLALGKATWDEAPSFRPARLGVGPQVGLGVIVEKAGRLAIPWSLHGERNELQELSCEIRVPSSAMNRIWLETPQDVQLVADNGLVTRDPKTPAPAGLLPSPTADSLLWLIELGGQTRTRLSLSSSASVRAREELLLVRETASYLFSPADVSADFVFQLDAQHVTSSALELLADSRLRLTSAQYDGRDITWRESAVPSSGPRRIMLDLGETVPAGSAQLRLSAVAPLTLDAPWRLPRIELAQGVWQEGTATLIAPPSLRLQTVGGNDVRQIAISTAGFSGSNETWQFQYHSPLATLDLLAARERPQLVVASGLVVRMEATQWSGTWQSDVSCDAGALHEIQLLLSNRWVVDSIESIPPELIEQRQFLTPGQDGQAVRLRLSRAVADRQKVRLIVRAHRPIPPVHEEIRAPDLWLARFSQTLREDRLIALRSADPQWEFQLAHDLDVARIDPEAASPEELSLLDSSPSGILFRLTAAADDLRIVPRPADPRYTVAATTVASVQRDNVNFTLRARLSSSSSTMSKILVRATPAPPADLSWALLTPNAGTITQIRRDVPASSSSSGMSEAIWELTLSRPSGGPLLLDLSWQAPVSTGGQVPLFSFPESAQQEGLVELQTTDATPFSWEAAEIKSLPVPMADGNQASPLRARLRYSPGRSARVKLTKLDAQETLPPAWIRECDLLSHFALDGSGLHTFHWQVETTGVPRLRFRLPEGTRLTRVAVDGKEGANVSPLEADGSLEVALPAKKRTVDVEIIVETLAPTKAGLILTTWQAPLVSVDVPVFHRRWRTNLPPGIAPVEEPSSSPAGSLLQICQRRLWSVVVPSLKEPGQLAESEEETHGWFAYQPSDAEVEHLALSVFRPVRSQTWGIAAGLVLAGFLFWFAPRRLAIAFLLGLVTLVGVILLPPPYVPLAAGSFWGIICAALGQLLVPPLPIRSSTPAEPWAASTGRYAAGGAVSLVIAGLWVTLATPHVFAAPEAVKEEAAVRPAARVVFPLDADQKPAGDYVYVPLEFYQRLYRLADEEGALPRWLVRSSLYELALPDVAAESPSAAARFTARLELETFRPDVDVELPFHRDQVHLIEGQTLLDGEPATLQWADAKPGLRVNISTAGVHSLELAFSAPAKGQESRRVLMASIPAAARGIVEITPAAGVIGLEFPGAQGQRLPGVEAGKISVDIGAIALFQAHWPRDANEENPATEVEQLVWWKVRPGSVFGEAQFVFRPLRASIRELRIEVDPRLRLLPLSDGLAIRKQWATEGETRTYHLLLAEPSTEAVTLSVKFLLLDASGVGQLRIPRLEALGSRAGRRWQAVSVHPSLDLRQSPEIATGSITSAAFSQAWKTEELPAIAYEVLPGANQPAFLIRPTETNPSCVENTEFVVSAQVLEAQFRASLSGLPPQRFEEHISVPAGLAITRVAVYENEALVPMRWIRNADSSVTVVRHQPPGNEQRVELTARLEKPLQGDLALPQLRLLGMERIQSEILIRRSEEVDLQVISHTDHQELAGNLPSAPSSGWNGRIAARYQAINPSQPLAAPVVIRTGSSAVAADYHLVTRLARTTARTWMSEVDLRVDIDSGGLDVIGLEIPAEWAGPFEITPTMEHQVTLIPGETRRRLLLRPAQPLQKTAHITIRGPLSLGTGDSVRPPDVIPLNAASNERYLLLPTRADQQQWEWQTSGLQAAAPQEEFGVLSTPQAKWEPFLVVAPRFEASLQETVDSLSSSRATLREVAITPRLEGGYSAFATWHLVPGGKSNIQMEIPAACRLIHVAVDGIPAQTKQQDEKTWQIHLASEQLPQRLSAWYWTDQLGDHQAGSKQEYVAPRLLGVPVTLSNWLLLDVDGIAKQAPVRNGPGSGSDSDANIQRERALMQSIINLVSIATEAEAFPLNDQELEAWLKPWLSDFAAARARWLGHYPGNSPRAAAARSEAELLSKQLTAAIAPLAKSEDAPLWNELAKKEPAESESQIVISACSVGSMETWQLPPDQESNGERLKRFALVAILLVLGVAMVQLERMGIISEWRLASPSLALAMVAMLICFLTPLGWVGLALGLLVAAWFALRQPWPYTELQRPLTQFSRAPAGTNSGSL